MVLLVCGSSGVSRTPTNLNELLMSSSRLRDAVDQFKANQKRQITVQQGLLYAHQHEYATWIPGDVETTILGSEDATTCHILIFRNTSSGATTLMHFDVLHEASLARVRDQLLAGSESQRLEVSLVGGYADEEGRSEQLSLQLIRFFIRDSVTYDLQLCCIGSLNTTVKDGTAFPIFYGCAVSVSDGHVFPAEFPDQGPEEILRHIRTGFNRSKDGFYFDVYKDGEIRIAPFEPYRYPGMEFWCAAPKEIFLETLSTSPKVEPPNFVPRLRETIKTVAEMKDPMETIFHGGKDIVYRRDANTKLWARQPVSDPATCEKHGSDN